MGCTLLCSNDNYMIFSPASGFCRCYDTCSKDTTPVGNSELYEICDGNGFAPGACDCDGTKFRDACGVCDGDGSSCNLYGEGFSLIASEALGQRTCGWNTDKVSYFNRDLGLCSTLCTEYDFFVHVNGHCHCYSECNLIREDWTGAEVYGKCAGLGIPDGYCNCDMDTINRCGGCGVVDDSDECFGTGWTLAADSSNGDLTCGHNANRINRNDKTLEECAEICEVNNMAFMVHQASETDKNCRCYPAGTCTYKNNNNAAVTKVYELCEGNGTMGEECCYGLSRDAYGVCGGVGGDGIGAGWRNVASGDDKVCKFSDRVDSAYYKTRETCGSYCESYNYFTFVYPGKCYCHEECTMHVDPAYFSPFSAEVWALCDGNGLDTGSTDCSDNAP